jgi:hypothetical protein
MKKIALCIIFVFAFLTSCTKKEKPNYNALTNYESSEKYPYGKANENAHEDIKTFDQLIGLCNCKSLQYDRNGNPGDTTALKWRWKYILNGNGVQDDGWYGNDTLQSAFTSIRIFNPQTKKWQVPFFTPNMTRAPNIWIGGREGNNIILRRPYQIQDSIQVVSTLTFSNISSNGFNWEGKSFFPTRNTSNVFWKIWCIKEK